MAEAYGQRVNTWIGKNIVVVGVLDCEEMAWDQAVVVAMFIISTTIEDALAALSEACVLVILLLRVGGTRASANHFFRGESSMAALVNI